MWGISFFEQIFNQMRHRRAINIGQMPQHFAINCNKFYINKSHSVQIAPTRSQNADQNPQGVDATPHMPPLGVNINRCIKFQRPNKIHGICFQRYIYCVFTHLYADSYLIYCIEDLYLY